MEEQKLVLCNYGVELRRLTHDKIEMVRCWRNSPAIRETMFFQDEITPEMQEAWFRKIDNDKNLYCIIVFRNEEIGLINVKDIETGTGESGIFIHDTRYLSTDIAYRSHLVLFDYVYKHLGLKYTYSHIRSDNVKAIRFAEFLGSEQDYSRSSESNLCFTLLADNYLNNVNRLRFINRWNKFN
jgi:RimJ/RimL family protein N-acetyltransferase